MWFCIYLSYLITESKCCRITFTWSLGFVVTWIVQLTIIYINDKKSSQILGWYSLTTNEPMFYLYAWDTNAIVNKGYNSLQRISIII
jgi:hypothetical protein